MVVGFVFNGCGDRRLAGFPRRCFSNRRASASGDQNRFWIMRQPKCSSGQPNFGTIEIDWNATPATLKLKVRDANGIPTMGVNLTLNELRRRSSATPLARS